MLFRSSKKKTGDSDNDGDETISNAMSKLLALSTEIEDDPSEVGDKDDEGSDSEDNEEGLEDEHQIYQQNRLLSWKQI